MAWNHLRDPAYTLKGWAMEDKLASRKPFEIITAEDVSYNCFLNVVNSFHRKYSRYSEVFRPSMTYTKQELTPPDNNYTHYLVVGYIKWDKDMNVWRLPHHYTRKGVTVGYQRPESGVEKWLSETPPLFIVTPIPTRKIEKAVKPKFYALLHPRYGLCTPYLIEEQYKFTIFWRWEFRSKANSIRERTCNINRRVWKQIEKFQRQGYGAESYIYDQDLSNNEETDEDDGAEDSNSEGSNDQDSDENPDEDSDYLDEDMEEVEVEDSNHLQTTHAPASAPEKRRQRILKALQRYEDVFEPETQSPEINESADIP